MVGVSILSVFLVGLLGGAHCASMCGGIVALLGSRHRVIPIRPAGGGLAAAGASASPAWALQVSYNAGRIATYAIAGGIAGAAGSAAWLAQNVLPVQQAAFVAANLVLILLGLYLAGFGRIAAAMEAAGARLWQPLKPLASRLLGATSVGGAFASGMVWGLVPCGMVYGVLVAALVSGSAADGALLMLAFGAGTLPNLLALGWAAQRGSTLLRHPGVRVAAGLLVLAFGVAGLFRVDPLAHLHGVVDACVSWF